LGFDQAELIEGHQRLLVCSGQDAVDADGDPQHLGDLAAQLELALDNLGAFLAAATSVLGLAHLPGQLLVMLEATAVD
jgi:enamine deaminase RidA (YjgF/YER057c/UK114 family)